MQKKSFKELRSSVGSNLFGSSIGENTLCVWDGSTHESLTEINCIFSGGRSRFLINEREKVVIVGTWEDGIRCYDLSTGDVIWERKEIIGVQSLQASFAIPESVFVSVEAPDYRLDDPSAYDGVLELATSNGKEKWRSDQFSEIYADPNSTLLVGVNCGEREIYFLDKGKRKQATIPMEYFAVLDVEFGKDSVLIAEGKCGIRIFDKKQFSLRGTWTPEGREANCIRAGYVVDRSEYLVQDSWDSSFLVHFSENGTQIKEQDLPSNSDLCFIDKGRYFIQRDGSIYSSEACKHLGKIEIK